MTLDIRARRNYRPAFGLLEKSRRRTMLTEGWRPAKVPHFFQNASHLATPVVIADENIFWLDGSETRFVPSLYIGNLFTNSGGVE